MRTIGKIVLILVLVSLITPFVKTACDLTLLSALEHYQAPMCHLEDISQTFGHLQQFQQFTSALVEPMNMVLLFVIFIIAASISLLPWMRRSAHRLPQSLDTISRHMKPWDPLRFAFAHGVIRRIDYT